MLVDSLTVQNLLSRPAEGTVEVIIDQASKREDKDDSWSDKAEAEG